MWIRVRKHLPGSYDACRRSHAPIYLAYDIKIYARTKGAREHSLTGCWTRTTRRNATAAQCVSGARAARICALLQTDGTTRNSVTQRGWTDEERNVMLWR